MKSLIRLAFVLLIALSVIGQLQAVRPYDADGEDAASLVAPLAGLGLNSQGPDADGVIVATAADCPLPVRIGKFLVAGGQEARAASLLGPALQPRYVYLGMVFKTADGWRLYFRGLHGRLAALIGERSKRAPSHMVMAALPDACPHLADLDWAVLSPWN